eukprot:3938631-Rhodomonas_salina.2
MIEREARETETRHAPGEAQPTGDSDDRREVCHAVADPLGKERGVARVADGKRSEAREQTHEQPPLRLAARHVVLEKEVDKVVDGRVDEDDRDEDREELL